MGAVWLTSRSLRLATCGKNVAFCISFVQSPFLYYKPKAHKEVGRLVETPPLSHSKPKKKPKNQETLQETAITVPISKDLATSLAGPYKSIKTMFHLQDSKLRTENAIRS